MHVEKKIVTDEKMRPVAVQISYGDWLEIERRLDLRPAAKIVDPSRHVGLISLTDDPAEFQKRLREEWQ